MRRLALLCLIVAAMLPAFGAPARAQSSSNTVYLRTTTIGSDSQDSITTACYTLLDFSQEGCDKNGDGLIEFQGVPAGTYTVDESTQAPGFLPAGDFPISVADSSSPQYFDVRLYSTNNNYSNSVNISVAPVDANSYQPLTGGCFQFYGGSEIGCDDNGDGQVGFSGMAAGTYLLTQTQAVPGYASMDDTWAVVNVDRQIQIELQPNGSSSGGQSSSGNSGGSQSSGNTIYVQTVDYDTGDLLTTACYVLVDFSQEGCDKNGDGSIEFQGVPAGDYTVHESTQAPGYLPVGDIPITVQNSSDPQYFEVELASAKGVTQQTVNVSVLPVDEITGESLTGGCFQFVGGSEIGCDDNGDGQVDFRGMAVGTYLLTETTDVPGYRHPSDIWAKATTNGVIYDYLGKVDNSNNPPTTANNLVDVAIVTRDPDDGSLIKGACYIINDASINGCDENGDGQVDYTNVKPGTYTVTQTTAPSGYSKVPDFKITIKPAGSPQVFTVPQGATFSNKVGNVSIELQDANTGNPIRKSGMCVTLVGGSDKGCDLNGDGYIDFIGVNPGQYEIQVTNIPNGYTYLHPSASGKNYATVTTADGASQVVVIQFITQP